MVTAPSGRFTRRERIGVRDNIGFRSYSVLSYQIGGILHLSVNASCTAWCLAF